MTFRAFTLVETIVVVSLTAFILITLGSLISYFYKTNAYTFEQSTAIIQARTGVGNAVLYLRGASYGSDGSYPIKSAATSSITFYANTNDTPAIERITYTLINQTFYRAIATPTGSPLSYANATIATSTISLPVVNGTSTPVFRYYDRAGAELLAPINISKISSVRTTIIVDANIERAPVAFTLSGWATLRNLKDRL